MLKISTAQLIGMAIPAIALMVFFSSFDKIEKRPDSGGYITFANDIVSGEFFKKTDIDDVRWHRAIRTPGYPLIIVLATGGDTDNIDNMLIAHGVIGLLSLIFLSMTLRQYCPPVITGSVVALSQFFMRDYFSTVMTEFTVFNLLLVIFGLTVICIRTPSFAALFFLGLVASLAVLVRPAVIPVMALMPLMFLFYRGFNIGEGCLLAVSTLPVLIWMSFNLHTIDAFTLTQIRGLQLLGVGTQVGYAEEKPDDPEGLKIFIRMMNERKGPKMGEEDAYINSLDGATTKDYRFNFYNNSLWIPFEIRLKLGVPVSPISLDRNFYEPYGRRAITANFGNYVKYFIYGMTVFFSFGFPYAIFLFLVVPFWGIYRRKNLVLSYAALVMFAIHFGVGVLVSGIEAVYDRYVIATFYPYIVAILTCLFGLLYAEGLHQRILSRLPERVSIIVDRVFQLE
jgi:hypothetical protein